jgi:DNA mismatch repair ATPase MutS
VKDLNRYVAIAEEFPHDPAGTVKTGGLLHDRKVSRIVTPGTLIDEPFMDPFANNYVLAVHLEKDALSIMTAESPDEGIPLTGQDQLRSMLVGLAWLDLSTGQFFTQTAPLESLSSAVSRIGPSEIILNEALRSTPEHLLSSLIGEEGDSLNYCSDQDSLPISEWSSVLEVEIPRTSAALLTESEVAAGGVLLKYVATRLQALDLKLQPPVRYEATGTMEIDRNSMRALEIRETIRDGTFRGSLLHAVRRTVTKGGARLLNEWLSTGAASYGLVIQD